MAPFPVEQIFGNFAYIIYFLIGGAFGTVLEMSGFGVSTKLASQFYFKDMTVLKVMFTGIITAMVLIFLSSALGLLDYELLWVNPTYLWPGIIGGVIMGFGFIIGGFCPGTSLVAVSTLKVDGWFFAAGSLFGIFLFGETVHLFSGFWNSSLFGRFTIPDWLGLPTGVVVVLIMLMALFMFWGGEHLERIFGKKDLSREPKRRYIGGAIMLALAVLVMILGQPTMAERWEKMADVKQPLLDNRDVYIHPGELQKLMFDDSQNLVLVDSRDESDYNLFHLLDAIRVKPADVDYQAHNLFNRENTIVVLMSNNEVRSTEFWKALTTVSIPNVYILEGGINYWLDIFGEGGHYEAELKSANSEEMRHMFEAALGSNQPAAAPELHKGEEIVYTPKVKLQQSVKKQGGCG
jgi:rhodanese-related sulfurtransferase